MPAESLVNGVASTLNGAITNSQTTITIATADIAKFPSSGNFRLAVTDNTNTELMLVTAGQGTATLTVTRAAESYNGAATGYAFASGSRVAQVLTVAGMNSLGPAGSAGDRLLLDYAATTDLASSLALTANTWTDIGTNQTFVVDDATATIELSASGNVRIGGSAGADYSSRLVIDSAGTAVNKMIGGGWHGTNTFGNSLAGAEPVAVTGLAVGSHTVKLQVMSNGSASLANCQAATAPNQFSLQIRVWQRPTVYRGGSVPSARVYNSTAQSTTNNTNTVFTFDSEYFDTDTIHDTSTNTSRLTCRTPGKYLLEGHVQWAANTANFRAHWLRRNGTDTGPQALYGPAPGGLATAMPLSFVWDLAVGDYIELVGLQNSGGSLNATAQLAMTRIGDVALGGPPDAYVNVQDNQAQNTQAGTFTSGSWQTRVLNTKVADTGSLASLASNRVTLPAGTWECRASAPAFGVHEHQVRLQNITDGTTLLLGTGEYAGAPTDFTTSRSLLCGVFTLSGTKALELQHRCATTLASEGLGRRNNFTTEVYAVAEFWKRA